jgi:hypothetical protein
VGRDVAKQGRVPSTRGVGGGDDPGGRVRGTACVVGAFVKGRRLDDRRLLVGELRPPALDVAAPSLRVRSDARPGVRTRSSQPLRSAGKLRKCTGAEEAVPASMDSSAARHLRLRPSSPDERILLNAAFSS